jgi:hypothetical protein
VSSQLELIHRFRFGDAGDESGTIGNALKTGG